MERTSVDLGEALNKLMSSCYYRYRGYPIEIKGSGYEINGRYYPTKEQAREEVDRMYESLGNSIKQP